MSSNGVTTCRPASVFSSGSFGFMMSTSSTASGDVPTLNPTLNQDRANRLKALVSGSLTKDVFADADFEANAINGIDLLALRLEDLGQPLNGNHEMVLCLSFLDL